MLVSIKIEAKETKMDGVQFTEFHNGLKELFKKHFGDVTHMHVAYEHGDNEEKEFEKFVRSYQD